MRSLVPVLVFLVACKGGPSTTPPVQLNGLRINEVMAKNDGALRDPSSAACAEFDDWIELVNAGDEPVDLTGVRILDTSDALALPSVELGPWEHVLIWADDQPEQGDWHAPFKVSADGERLELWRGDILLDAVDVPPLGADRSWARTEDGVDRWEEVGTSTPGASNHYGLPQDDPCFVRDGGFEDHSYPCISTVDSYQALAGDRSALEIVKFDIFAFSEPSERRMAYVDTNFYALHDEFYLFTVFNGEVFEGLEGYPPYDGVFETYEGLETWAATTDLASIVDPNQARFSGPRFYSPYFYAAINGEDRTVGVGTVLHRPATDDLDEIWAFELEYADDITYDDLVVYFETLEATGPAPFADIHWLVRSPEQEALAVWMADEGRPYADRVLRYADLTTEGNVEVYNPGITAGRVRVVKAGEDGLEEALPTDVLVLDALPDYLPPCAALLTSVPQTPLSHVALLARSRGIPNLHVAGITEDPQWDAWNRLPTRVVVEADEHGVRFGELPYADYLRWRSLATAGAPAIEPVDWAELPWSYDLREAPGMLDLRRVAGGKAAGMRHLLEVEGVDVPDTPLALSVRAYHEHLASLGITEGLLDDVPFTDPNAVRERFLVLEGREAYDERYPTVDDALVADRFLDARPAGDTLGDLGRTEGLAGAIARAPVPSEVLHAIEAAVEAQFAWLPLDEGLRFRSSSTVEDVEGFNGAGLYTSATGYRSPEDGQASVADAVREVWASYWGAEAFEERASAGLVHLDGGMGVLVHPRFDDDYEQANAVLTVSILPDGSHEVLVNVQAGAVSVANPPTTCPPVLPETLRMTDAAGFVVLDRLGASTEVEPGEIVLSDADARTLFDGAVAAAEEWLAVENASLPTNRRRSVLTLDLEARHMGVGWLAGTDERLVVKQARSLEPSLVHLPELLQDLPAPQDLLARADRIEGVTCLGEGIVFSARALTTDPFLLPDMGFADELFVVQASVWATDDFPELGWSTGDGWSADHSTLENAAFDSTFGFVEGTVDWTTDALTVDDGESSVVVPATCTAETIWAHPDRFLLDYLD